MNGNGDAFQLGDALAIARHAALSGERGDAVSELTVHVRGTSMQPAIRPDSRVGVRLGAMPFPGDIALVDVGGGHFFLHRAVAYEYRVPRGWHIVTASDTTSAFDAPVPLASVLGVAKWVENGGVAHRLGLWDSALGWSRLLFRFLARLATR